MQVLEFSWFQWYHDIEKRKRHFRITLMVRESYWDSSNVKWPVNITIPYWLPFKKHRHRSIKLSFYHGK